MGRVVVPAAVVLVGIGLLLIAFVAYQLWGTALYEARAQSHLKSELAHQLHRTLPTSATDLAQRNGLRLAHQTAPTVPDPAINDPVGLLSIPRIGLLDAIVEGVGDAQLEQGPGHYPGTALPGEAGNVAIAGHRTTYAHPFYNLDALSPGDPIYILTSQGLFHYTVAQTQIVSPTDVTVLETVPGQNTLTLTTCNPRYSAAQRLVVTADFDGRTRPARRGPRARSPSSPPSPGDGGAVAASTRSSALGGGSASWVPASPVGPHHRRARRDGRGRVALGADAAGASSSCCSPSPSSGLALLVCFEHVSLALPGSY